MILFLFLLVSFPTPPLFVLGLKIDLAPADDGVKVNEDIAGICSNFHWTNGGQNKPASFT